MLEVVFPVRLSMFGVDPFTVVVLPGIGGELVLFVAAARRASVLVRPGPP